jgi:hypothetical protein
MILAFKFELAVENGSKTNDITIRATDIDATKITTSIKIFRRRTTHAHDVIILAMRGLKVFLLASVNRLEAKAELLWSCGGVSVHFCEKPLPVQPASIAPGKQACGKLSFVA